MSYLASHHKQHHSKKHPGGMMSKLEETQELRRKIRRRKPRKTGTLQDALALQWQAIGAAWEAMLVRQEMGDDAMVLKAAHAVTQATMAYAKLLETSDLEAEMDALKEELREIKQAQGLRRVG